MNKKSRKRGKRLAKTESVIKKRTKRYHYGSPCGMHYEADEQPNRFAKQKQKFTTQRGSLKKDKQIASRASRRKRKMAAKKEEEPKPERRSSVKWSYW